MPSGEMGRQCDYVRAAKFRTRIERELFRLAKHLEEHA
jgi:hypothetical protein